MSNSTKYTKEVLEPIVLESVSYSDVIRKLGIKWSGGQQQNIKQRIKLYGLDISHFLGQGANSGILHKGGTPKVHWSKILVILNKGSMRQKTIKLRRALIESGREYKCERCHNTGKWLGCSLTLQVDHINKDWLDNRKENLRFLCPNCHTQTEGWSGSKGGTGVLSESQQARNRRAKKMAS